MNTPMGGSADRGVGKDGTMALGVGRGLLSAGILSDGPHFRTTDER